MQLWPIDLQNLLINETQFITNIYLSELSSLVNVYLFNSHEEERNTPPNASQDLLSITVISSFLKYVICNLVRICYNKRGSE